MATASAESQNNSAVVDNPARAEEASLGAVSVAETDEVRLARHQNALSLKARLRYLTPPQIGVVTTMMAKIVEANRSLLHVTSVMARAALKGDREAFKSHNSKRRRLSNSATLTCSQSHLPWTRLLMSLTPDMKVPVEKVIQWTPQARTQRA